MLLTQIKEQKGYSVTLLQFAGLPTPKFRSEPHISLQGTSWEPKSNIQNHFRTNEKKSILTRKNTFYLTLSARGLYNYSELFPSLGISVDIRF